LQSASTLASLGLVVSLAVLGVAAQDRMLPVPANVTVDGVPPVPMALVEAVAPYGQFRQARFVAWHPTERQMVVVTTFANAPQLHQVRFPGGARAQLTFFSDGVPSRPGAAFSADGGALVFQKDTAGGGEANQLFRYDVRTGAITMLTDGRSRNGVPVVSADGRIAYDSTRHDGRNRLLHVLSLANPSDNRLLTGGEGTWTALGWSADGNGLLALQLVSSAESYLWRVDARSGEKTLLTPRGERPVRWFTAAFAPDGQTVHAVGNLNSESPRVWRYRAGDWTPITDAGDAIEGFAMSPDGRTIAVAIDAGSSSRLQLLDADGKARPTPAVPPGVISDLVWHPSRNEVAFNLAGARAFSDVYSLDVEAARLERWTLSEMGGANPETLPDAEIVRWKSFDGLEISGVLYRPAPSFTGPRPVIINVHGGPSARERPRAIGRSNYFRNELGIAVIYPNIRGSSGFGRSFEAADNGLLRENAVKDIGALLDWIARQPELDESRVMIAGPSYGGFIALASAIAYGDRLRGVNPAFGITDFPSFLESTEMSRQANRNAEYGDPADPQMRAFLSRISPLTNAQSLKVPVFIVAGAKDTRVPISQAESIVKALKANGTPVWYVRFEDAGHEELTPATNNFSIYTWVLFVQKYLLS
jgi:dipeptidyl aminopeptidase/acylaminoacyl peptidase